MSTCQICGRAIKASTGVIAHHGYKRPSMGWQTSSCSGARELPYEQSRDAIMPVMQKIVSHTASLDKSLNDLMANPPEKLEHVRYDAYGRLREKFEAVRPDDFDPNHYRYEIRSGMPKSYEYIHRHRASGFRQGIKANADFLAFLRARYDAWKAPAEQN